MVTAESVISTLAQRKNLSRFDKVHNMSATQLYVYQYDVIEMTATSQLVT